MKVSMPQSTVNPVAARLWSRIVSLLVNALEVLFLFWRDHTISPYSFLQLISGLNLNSSKIRNKKAPVGPLQSFAGMIVSTA
jgi:hypothetical protein